MGIAEASQGAPTVAEYAVAEFAAGIGLSTEAGKAYLGEALELRYRLPRTWQRVVGGDLPGWKARLVARETTRLSARRRVKPRQVVLNVHLSHAAVGGNDPVARLERGDALVTADQVRTWCGHPDAQVVVKPVIDLNDCVATDSDDVPDRIAERVSVRDRTCVFPWCTRPARSCDRDHVIARARGPTCTCNIAALCRRHHRLKTHTPWTYLVLDPGTYLWTSPHGYQYLRDHTGTLHVSADRPHPATPPDP